MRNGPDSILKLKREIKYFFRPWRNNKGEGFARP